MTDSLAIIVVSYNTRELTLACLRSIFEHPPRVPFRICVVDNASSDGSADAIESEFDGRVELSRLQENVGFAAGNNIAAANRTERFLLLLNPDTLVLDDAINRLMEFAGDHAGGRIYGGVTVFADGAPNPMSCWMKATPWSIFCWASGLSRRHSSKLFNPEQPDCWGRRPKRVDIVSGCFLLIQRELWESLGGFDSSYFMYGEEADLCLRARRFGASPMVSDRARIVHFGGASERVRADKLIRLLHSKYRLCVRFWRFPFLAAPLFSLLVLARAVSGKVGAIVGRPGTDGLAVWSEVWRRRDRWLSSEGGYDPASTEGDGRMQSVRSGEI